MPKKAKSKNINIANKWKQWYIKIDSNLLLGLKLVVKMESVILKSLSCFNPYFLIFSYF